MNLSSSEGEGPWGSPAGVMASTTSPSYVKIPGKKYEWRKKGRGTIGARAWRGNSPDGTGTRSV